MVLLTYFHDPCHQSGGEGVNVQVLSNCTRAGEFIDAETSYFDTVQKYKIDAKKYDCMRVSELFELEVGKTEGLSALHSYDQKEPRETCIQQMRKKLIAPLEPSRCFDHMSTELLATPFLRTSKTKSGFILT